VAAPCAPWHFVRGPVRKSVIAWPFNGIVRQHPHEMTSATPEPPDLAQIEEVAFDLSVESIREFAAQHADERFYAFGLDINAEYGDLLLCLNTDEDFRETAKRYIAEWNYSEADLAQLRRNFGDWKYQGFNLKQSLWKDRWKPFKDAFENYIWARIRDEEDDDLASARHRQFVESTMVCFCRVLVRIEHSGVLRDLARDADFFTHVQDHDESDDDANERLATVRRQLGQRS